jgi:hypothetical protein
MKDEIVKVIAEYLDEKTEFRADFVDGKKTSQVYFKNAVCSTDFLEAIAADIAEKVLAVVSEKDFPYGELFDHIANEHGLTLNDTDLSDIIHIARGGGQKAGLQIGARVKIVAKIETNDRFAHHFQIGHLGTITSIDLSDPLYQYLIDDHDYGWVTADEIELIE